MAEKPETARNKTKSSRAKRQRGYIENYRARQKEMGNLELRSLILPDGYQELFKAINFRVNELAAEGDKKEYETDVVFRFKNTTDCDMTLGDVFVVIDRKRVEVTELSGVVVPKRSSMIYRRHQLDSYLASL